MFKAFVAASLRLQAAPLGTCRIRGVTGPGLYPAQTDDLGWHFSALKRCPQRAPAAKVALPSGRQNWAFLSRLGRSLWMGRWYLRAEDGKDLAGLPDACTGAVDIRCRTGGGKA